jgi:hypothetical protein
MKRFILNLSQIGTFLLTAFGGFYTRIAPPQDSLRFWPGYACLVSGIACIVVTSIKERSRLVILCISILPALVFPAIYYTRYQALTAAYGGSQVICGTVLTVKGADYASKNPDKTREEIIRDFAGEVGEIWTQDSINRASLVLGLTYSAAVGFLAFAVLTGLQQAKPPKAVRKRAVAGSDRNLA